MSTFAATRYVLESPSRRPRSFRARTFGNVIHTELGSHSARDQQAADRRDAFIVRLDAACSEASKDSWDGAGTFAVKPDGRNRALGLYDILPLSLPLPDVSVAPTGVVAFDWTAGADFQLSMLLVEGSQVSVASYIADQSFHKSFPFDASQLPSFVYDKIRAWTRGAVGH